MRTTVTPYDTSPVMAKSYGQVARYYTLERTLARLYKILPTMAKLYGVIARYYDLVWTVVRLYDLLMSRQDLSTMRQGTAASCR